MNDFWSAVNTPNPDEEEKHEELVPVEPSPSEVGPVIDAVVEEDYQPSFEAEEAHFEELEGPAVQNNQGTNSKRKPILIAFLVLVVVFFGFVVLSGGQESNESVQPPSVVEPTEPGAAIKPKPTRPQGSKPKPTVQSADPASQALAGKALRIVQRLDKDSQASSSYQNSGTTSLTDSEVVTALKSQLGVPVVANEEPPAGGLSVRIDRERNSVSISAKPKDTNKRTAYESGSIGPGS